MRNDGVDLHEAVRDEVMGRVMFFINDCRTLDCARREMPHLFGDRPTAAWGVPEYGRGNYLMALGLMSTIGFLAKVDWWLVNSAKLKQLMKQTRPHWDGGCPETRAFSDLVKAMSTDGITLGVPDQEADAVWRQFRNKLAHMIEPNGFVEVSQERADAGLPDPQYPFRKEQRGWLCNADILCSCLEKQILPWILAKLDAAPALELEPLCEWVRRDVTVRGIRRHGENVSNVAYTETFGVVFEVPPPDEQENLPK